MDSNSTARQSQQIATGNNNPSLGSQAQNTSISPAAAASSTLVGSPSPRSLPSPSPLALPPPLVTLEEPAPAPSRVEAPLSYFSAEARRGPPVDDIQALWNRHADKRRIQALWRDPIAINKTAAYEKIRNAWTRYDLDRPLPGNRADDPEKKLQFRYGFKTV